MTRKTINGSPGLVTAANAELSPPGSLKQALGCIIKRPGIIEKLRPWRQYASSVAFDPGAIFVGVGDCLVVTDFDGVVSVCESSPGTPTFAACSSPIDVDRSPPSVASASGNVYIANQVTGVAKQDTASANFYKAGVPPALSPQLSLITGSLLATGDTVAYRVCFTHQDANGLLVIGPPCGRTLITATGAQNVSLKVFIPADIYNAAAAVAISYRVQVYRSDKVTTGLTPTDEMKLCYDGALIAADIAAKYTTIVDFTPDALKGPDLYTNASQEGIIRENSAPPPCSDMATFKGRTWFARTSQKQRATLQMLAMPEIYTISTGAGGITRAGAITTYTLTGTPTLTGITAGMILSVTGCTTAANNGDFVIVSFVAGTSITVTSVAQVTEAGAAAARCTTGRLTLAGTTYDASLVAEDVANRRYLVTNTSPATQAAILAASDSLIRVINQTVAATVYAYNASGVDQANGIIGIYEKTFSTTQFTGVATGDTFSTRWSPTITAAFPLTSKNDATLNRLHYSKYDKPESCPMVQSIDIGSASRQILKLVPLREALLVFKEDGLFRVTSDGDAIPAYTPLDLTQTLLSRNLVTTLHNRAYAITTRGAWMFTESASSPIGLNVANKISRFTDSPRPGLFGAAGIDSLFHLYTSATSSETDNAVYFRIIYDQTTHLGVELVYNASNGTWTEQYANGDGITGQFVLSTFTYCSRNGARVALDTNADIYIEDQYVDSVDSSNIFYDGLSGSANQETGQPVPAHKYLVSISNVNAGASQITATKLAGPALAVGTILRENGTNSGAFYVVTVVAGAVLTLAKYVAGVGTFNFSVAQCYQYCAQPVLVEWSPFTSGDDADGKRFRSVAIALDPPSNISASSVTVGTYTETDSTVQSALGPPAAGDSVPVGVPASQQSARRLSVRLSHSKPMEYVLIRGISFEVEEVAEWKDSN